MDVTKEELESFVPFSKDFMDFEKIEIALPTDVIEAIKEVSQKEGNSYVSFDGTVTTLLRKALGEV